MSDKAVEKETKIPEQSKDSKAQKPDPAKQKSVSLSRILSLATRGERAIIYTSMILSVINGASMPALLYVWGDSTDAFTDKDETMDKVRKNMIIFFIMGAISFIIYIFQVAGFKHTGQAIAQRLREKYFRSIMRQEMGWFDVMNPAELSVKAESECNKVIDGIEEKLMTLYFSLASLIFGIVVGYLKGWQLALIVTGVLPFLMWAGAIYAKTVVKIGEKRVQVYQKAGALAHQAITQIRTVVGLCGEKKEVQRYGEAQKQIYDAIVKYGLLQGFTFGLVYLFQYSSYFFAFYFGGVFIDDKVENHGMDRVYSAGDVTVVLFALMIGVFQLSISSPSIQALEDSKAAAYRVFEIIERKSKIDYEDTKGEKLDKVEGKLEFKNVKFAYPINPEKIVLKGMSLTIEPNKKTALVGESGSGKSTCVQLLQRFYDPLEGEIQLDGKNLNDLNLKWWRSQMSYVGQEPVLFSKSIRENLALAKDNVTEDEMIAALKKANAYEFVMHLEKGLDTFVGGSGGQLSGGQKQRIAIARAIIKDSPILLLDEATSALDRKNEKEIQETLDSISKDRTTIVIAHRLTTVKNADKIFLLGSGELLESGTHDELIKKEGRYYNLQKAQLLADEESNNEEKADPKNIEVAVTKGQLTSIKKETSDKKEAAKEKEKEDKQALKKLYRYAKPERTMIFLSCFFSMCNGVIPPISTLFFAEMLEILLNPNDPDFMDDILFWSLMCIVIAVASVIFYSIQSWMFGIQAEKLVKRMRMDLLDKFLRQEIAWHDKEENNPSVLNDVLQDQVNRLGSLMGSVVGILAQAVSIVGVGIIISFTASWQLSLLCLGCFPIMLVSGTLISSITTATAQLPELQQSQRVISEVINNMKTVVTFGRERAFLDEYEKVLPIVRKKIQKKGYSLGMGLGLSNLFMFLIFGVLFFVGAKLFVDEGLGLRDMFLGMFALTFAAFDLGAIMQLMPDVGKAVSSAKIIFKYMEMESAIDIDDKQGKLTTPIKGDIELRNVTFKFPTRTKKVFKNFSFKSQAGKSIGLVGTSGCGKSTIMQLLLRFYDVQSGEVLIDGKNIKEYDLHHLRSQMSIISQEPDLFNESIRGNIKYSNPQATDDEMKEVAETAKALNFIQNSEVEGGAKLDTSQGTGFDRIVGPRGSQVSGGQKQRIAIARALIRKPNVLLLDEATSALDSQTEKEVQNNLNKVMKGKTSLIIAHRFATIKECDEIHVFKEGEVVEKGTYQELTDKKGYFYMLERGLN